MVFDYVDEFLKRYYYIEESKERNYYKNYLKFFCNPVFLYYNQTISFKVMVISKPKCIIIEITVVRVLVVEMKLFISLSKYIIQKNPG